MHKRLLLTVAITTALAGCATPFATQNQAQRMAERQVSEHIEEFEQTALKGSIREISAPRVDFTPTVAAEKRGDVFIKAAAAPFAPIVGELARDMGYSVAYAEGVDALRQISVDFNGAFTEDALRTTAFLAGYAAVIDRKDKVVYISPEATYNYRLPSAIFKDLQAEYSVGGDPANSASGGEDGGGGGGASLKAEFTIEGKEGTNGQGLSKFLQSLAGQRSEVLVTDQGVVSVRGNAQSLRRVNDFLTDFVKDAMTQVEIEASVIEVALAKDFSMGIQWGKVLQVAGNVNSGVGLGLNQSFVDASLGGGSSNAGLVGLAAASAAEGSLGGYRTSASSASIINALMRFTTVNVVSQPRMLSLNNNPATFFEGSQVPYLGKMEQSTSEGTSTVSGSVSFAIDGVSFSAVPSVVNDSSVQITLMPVLTSVGEFSQFLGGQLTVPSQSSKQTYMRVLAESGKTLILGGIRYNKDVKDSSVGSSTASQINSKEIVILLRANIVVPLDNSILMSESL